MNIKVGLACLAAFVAASGHLNAGTFIPVVTDQTPAAPLANPIPTNFEPRYISGFGTGDAFTVVYEDRRYPASFDKYPMFLASTTNGPTGFSPDATTSSIKVGHVLIKDWPITINGTNYNYRGWSGGTSNSSFGNLHSFFVSQDPSNWVYVVDFPIPRASGFTGDTTEVLYGFHDVIPINGKYYAWAEAAGGATYMCRSQDGATNWEAFACIGGDANSPGPLLFPGGSGPTPSGNFVDLGHNRGYGKIYMGAARDAYYMAINTSAVASLPAAELEAAFIQTTNWTWNNGTIGVCTSVATPILTRNATHDLRECWVSPGTNADAKWTIVYCANFGAANGGLALGYAILTPPSPGLVHNVTKDLYYDTIQQAIDAADEWDFIHVAPGSFGPFVLNKRLTIEGSGSTADPAVSTIVTGGTPTIQLQVGGTSATDRVELRNLYVTGGRGGVPLNENSGVEIQGAADIGHVTFSNVTFVGNAGCGIAVDFSFNLSDIVVRDCIFQSNTYYGIRLPTGLNCWDLLIEGCLFTNNLQGGVMSYAALTNVAFRDSTFVGNAPGVDQLAEIVLSPFNGDAVFENLTFFGNSADAAIRLSGTNTAKMAGGPCGNMSFSNITVQGTYSHAAIQFSRYTTAASVSFTNVELTSTSPVALHLGTMDGDIDLDAIVFNGTNSQGNIVLGRHGDGYASPSTYSNATVGVDATAVVFTGASGNYGIEDRIVHGPDIQGLGTVTWVVGNVFVTPVSGSVGRGIRAAASGDTVTVAPGTYTQYVAAVISNSMTIRSDGGDCGSGVVLTGTNGIFSIADDVSVVTIQGFSFQGVTGDDCISGDVPAAGQNNVTIISNCFEDIEYAAIAAEGNAGPNTRTNWLVIANRIDGVTGSSNSAFRFMVLQDSRIEDNTLQDIAYDGMTLEALVNVAISGNVISNTYACGIQVANNSAPGGTPLESTNVTIVGNTIVNANTNNSSDKGAIVAYPDVAGLLVTGNLLTGNENGFMICDQAGAVSAGIHVNANNIYGNAGYGAANFAQGGGTLDAENNWWGSYAGPGATDGGGRTGDTVNAGVDFTPWTYGKYGRNYDGDGLLDPDDSDDDEDSYSDVDEVSVGTDPIDGDSFPADVGGTVGYGGSQTGTVYVIVTNVSTTWIASMVDPGFYSVSNLPTLGNYWVRAFRDSNGNATQDTWEATGQYAGNPLYLTNHEPAIDVTLADPTVDTDSDGLTDYDEVYVTGTDPFDDDCDDDGLKDGTEVNVHFTNPRNSDSDDDGMPDGWEVSHSLNPLADDTEGDPDSDDLSNYDEYVLQTDPQDADSDNDQFEDGDEVLGIGSNPNNVLDPVVVDDDAPGDPGAGDPTISDPAEEGSAGHPYDAIQEGIGAATNTMIVLVLNGTFNGTGNRDIRPNGKAITIRSRNGYTNSFIEAVPAKGFICDSGETTDTVVRGFSIRTDVGYSGQEGVYCNGGSPTILDCRIRDSRVGLLCTNGANPVVRNCAFEDLAEGGIRIYDSSPRMERCSIVSNTAALGAGVYVAGASQPFMVNCLLADNQSTDEGGGLYIEGSSFVTNIHCTIAGNSAANRGGGLSSPGSSEHLFRNTVIYSNSSATNPCFYSSAAVGFQYCCLESNNAGIGNITNNPLFAGVGDYRLGIGSPAIDSGAPAFDPGIDLPGVMRPLDGDSNGTARVDIGAYEFWHPSVDTDGDGLLDQQEVYMYFTDPTDWDTDDDGFGDGTEIVFADTKPLLRKSHLRVISINRTNAVTVTFTCTNSRNYSLEYTDGLKSGVWMAMPDHTNLPGQAGGFMSLMDSNPPVLRAYRVGVQAP